MNALSLVLSASHVHALERFETNGLPVKGSPRRNREMGGVSFKSIGMSVIEEGGTSPNSFPPPSYHLLSNLFTKPNTHLEECVRKLNLSLSLL
ncbi:hypothetical protein BcDW1_5301 [Botrytis cinerea BcDW1]|uniref:Uncharacterized protein n=1 Tax=Botryotinia fuckeliana (strain BcDW1) TaxID=1290391 RepID=M7TR34_BOTF1|nr:hypothetical protein BcDW1_5301 [Botrytis cinerea BcDW1]